MWWCVHISSVFLDNSLLLSKHRIQWYAFTNKAIKYVAIQCQKESPIRPHRKQQCLRDRPRRLPPTHLRHDRLGGLFHLQPLLRGWPPAARWQAAASSCCCSSLAMLPSSRWWRLAFDRRSGKWFIVVLSKKLVTQVRSSYAGKLHKLAKIVEPRVTNTSKITQHTVPKLVNFRRNYVPILERSRNFGHLS